MDKVVKIAIAAVVIVAIGAVAYYGLSGMLGDQLEEYHVRTSSSPRATTSTPSPGTPSWRSPTADAT